MTSHPASLRAALTFASRAEAERRSAAPEVWRWCTAGQKGREASTCTYLAALVAGSPSTKPGRLAGQLLSLPGGHAATALPR